MAQNIYREVLLMEACENYFPSVLDNSAADLLCEIPPRAIRRVIFSALGQATLDELDELTAELLDRVIEEVVDDSKTKIGFL